MFSFAVVIAPSAWVNNLPVILTCESSAYIDANLTTTPLMIVVRFFAGICSACALNKYMYHFYLLKSFSSILKRNGRHCRASLVFLFLAYSAHINFYFPPIVSMYGSTPRKLAKGVSINPYQEARFSLARPQSHRIVVRIFYPRRVGFW